MKSGRSIQDVSREILRQQEAKADYLVATDRLHMDTWGDSPVIRVLDREGIDQIEPLEIQQTAHQQIGTYLDIPSKYYDRMLQRDPALLSYNVNRWFQKEPEQKEEEDVIDIEAKPEITFDDFGKMQFQVGEIIACEEVKKSKKLLCSQVKIGSQVKQIVSGIKKQYSAEEMVGKKVMVLVNLKPAKLAGVLSEGMLLCAEDADGNLSLMTPEKNMPAGAEIC